MFIATLSIVPSQKLETNQIPSANEWIHRVWHIYTVEYYSAVKMNELLDMQQHDETQNNMLRERNQTRKHIIDGSNVCEISRKGKTIQIESGSMIARD